MRPIHSLIETKIFYVQLYNSPLPYVKTLNESLPSPFLIFIFIYNFLVRHIYVYIYPLPHLSKTLKSHSNFN